MTRKVKPLIHFEQLEPRIMLSGDGLLNITPSPNQESNLENPYEIVQEVESLHIDNQVEAQPHLESTQSNKPNSDSCQPLFTLRADEDNANDDSINSELKVDDIRSAQIDDVIAVLSSSPEDDIDSKVIDTEDESIPTYINDADLSIEYATSIDIRGPPASDLVDDSTSATLENIALQAENIVLDEYTGEVQAQSGEFQGLYLVDPDVNYFDGQVIYLDFDGEEGVTYNGPVAVEGINIPEFSAESAGQAGQENAIISEILTTLEQEFGSIGVLFKTSMPVPGSSYSTIYIGGDDSAFQDYGRFWGLAEDVDFGNQSSCDKAFVFSDSIISDYYNLTSITTALVNVIVHETGHLLGYTHDYKDSSDLLSSLALVESMILTDNAAWDELSEIVLFGDKGISIDKNVTINDGFIASNGNIRIDKYSQIQGTLGDGKLNVDKYSTILNDIVVNGKVTLSKDVVVDGNINGETVIIGRDVFIDGQVTAAGHIIQRSGSTVTGGIIPFGSPDVFSPIILPSASVFETDPDNDIHTHRYETITLEPGKYGDLHLGVDNIINLSSGQYFFDRILTGRRLDLNLDLTSGKVEIYVLGNVNFGKDLDVFVNHVNMTDVDPELAAGVFIETHGQWQLHKEGQWFGTIFAPNDRIVLHKDCTLIGAAYSDSVIRIKKGTTIDFVPLDTTPPIVEGALSNDTGRADLPGSWNDHITSDPTIIGTITDNSPIGSVLVTLEPLYTNAIDVINDPAIQPDGSFVFDWSFFERLLGKPLVDGYYTFKIQAEDIFGNTSDIFELSFTLDTTPPIISKPDLRSSSDSGINDNDNLTNITTPTIDVDTEAGAMVHLFIDGVEVDQNTTGPLYTFTLAPLAENSYVVTATGEDVAGNIGISGSLTIQIDTTAPVVTVDTLLTNDDTPELTGTVDDQDAFIDVTVAGNSYSATNNANGTWTLADNMIPPALADSTYDVIASATDSAGNSGTDTTINELTIDTIAPVVTVDTLLTNDNTPQLTGTVDDPDASILVTVYGNTYTAINNGDGTWTLVDNTINPALADGTYDVTANAQDPAGNIGTDATTDELTVDTTPPVVTVDTLLTNDNTPVLSGTVDDSSAVVYVIVSGNTYSATNNGDGIWTLADNTISPALSDGTYDVSVSATDLAGNVGTDATTNELTVDTTAPVVTVDALLTNDSTPELTGTVDDAGAVIEATVDGNTYSAVNNGDGTWTLVDDTIGPALADGVYDVEASATDLAGNIGTDTTTNELTVDTTPPVVDFNLATVSDSEPIGDNRTIFDVVTLEGSTEPNIPVSLFLTADLTSPIGATTSDSNGSFAFNDISLVLGDNQFTVVATDLVGNEGTSERTIIREEQEEQYIAYLVEGTNFEVIYEQTFVVPTTPSFLSFTYSNLFFDKTDDFINDAFEAALLDNAGNSLVHRIANDRDAFFNITEEVSTSIGVNTAIDGQTVNLDLSHIPGGTQANLIIRLVNNDLDTTTSVYITHISVESGSLGTPVGAVLQLEALAATDAIDFTLLSDVTASIQAEYGRTSFNEDADFLYADLQLQNVGTYVIDTPLVAVIDHLSDPSVQVIGADGVTLGGQPYFDFSILVADGTLDPSELTNSRDIAFYNPNGIHFTYDLIILGMLNHAPEFISDPDIEALTGRPYNYDPEAIDPDEDVLAYSLQSAPEGMTIDPATGSINWEPLGDDTGNHMVLVHVEDGRGGSAEQHYALSVIEPPPNRPPVITSTPITEATVAKTFIIKEFDFNVDGVLPSAEADTEYINNNVTNIRLGIPGDPDVDNITEEEAYSVSGGILSQRTLNKRGYAYYQSSSKPGFDSALGLVIEARFKILDILGDRNTGFWVDDGINRYHMLLEDEGAKFCQGLECFGELIPFDVDIGGSFHTYRLESSGNSSGFDFFVDGANISSGIATNSSINGWSFGDGSWGVDNDADVDWDYIRFTQIAESQPYTYDVEAIDPDDDELTYALATAPEGMVINTNTGLIRWRPTVEQLGTHDVTVEVSDGRGGMATQTFVVDVRPDPENHPPVIVSEPVTALAIEIDVTQPQFTPIELTPSDVGSTSSSVFSTLPTEDPMLFGFTDGDIRRVNFDTAPDGSLLPSGTVLTDQYESVGVMMNGIQISSSVYGGPESPPNATWSPSQQGYLMIFTFTEPVIAVGLINTSPDQDLIEYYSPFGELLFTTRDQDGLPKNYNIDRFVGARVTDNNRIGSIVFANNTGNMELDELVFQVSPPLPEYLYDVEAIDPDNDPLVYELVRGPEGMTVDSETGLLQWQTHADPSWLEQVEYSDNVFAADDWQSTFVGFEGGGNSSIRTLSSGGNPGSCHAVTVNINGATAPDLQPWVFSFQFNTSATYDPRTQGAILSVDSSLDYYRSGISFNGGIAIRQGGKIYMNLISVAGNQWISKDFTAFTARDFSLVNENGNRPYTLPIHPDFSDSGEVIEFGYLAGSANGPPGYPGAATLYCLIDNWSVTVTPVRREGVSVIVEDGRGGEDLQSFVITNDHAGEVRGHVFNDINMDENWQRTHDLVIADGNYLSWYDAKTYSLIQRIDGGYNFAVDSNGVFFYWSDSNSISRFDPALNEHDLFFISKSELSKPYGITIGPDGDLYVTNMGSDDIRRFDPVSGELKSIFASEGMITPWQMEFGPDGDLYVADLNAGILRYDGADGTFLGVFANLGSPGAAPSDVVFGPDGDLYVSTWYSHPVVRYDGVSGAFKEIFVPLGTAGITRVGNLTFGPEGDLYVSSLDESRLVRFDGQTGDFIDIVVQVENQQACSEALFISRATSTQEEGLEGQAIFIDLNRNGRMDLNEPTNQTDASGEFVIGGLAPGTYAVGLVMPLGYLQTSPKNGHQIVEVNQQTSTFKVDFGLVADQTPQLNDNPLIHSIAPLEAITWTPYIYRVGAFDMNGDPLTFDLPVGPQGMTISSTTGDLAWRPRLDQVGTHDVILRVQDGRGGVDLQAFQVTVGTNSAPVITSLPFDPAVAGVLYQYNITSQDADNDPLAFDLVEGPGEMIVETGSGILTWTPTAGDVGDHFIRIRVADDQNAEDTQSFTLPVVPSAGVINDPPSITSVPRTTIGLGDRYVYRVEATDPNGDPLIFGFDQWPDGMTIDADGLILWTPASQQLGDHSVSIRIEDGRGGFATQSFILSVVQQTANTAPRIVSVPSFSAIVAELYEYNAVAEDAENDLIVWSLATAPDNVSIDAMLGTLRWTPSAPQIGFHLIVVQATDAQGASVQQGFGVNVRSVNTPPNITSVPPTEAFVDYPYSYAVRAEDINADGLSFSLVTAPAGMTIGETTGPVEWTPGAAQVGMHDVTIMVDDGRGGVGQQSYQLSVVNESPNEPPTITSTPDFVATVGQTYQYQVVASDPEGLLLTYQRVAGPAALDVDSATGLVTWTPTADQVGPNTVQVAALDPFALGASQTFTVTVGTDNAAPVLNNTPRTTTLAEELYAFDMNVTDSDGDVILYTLTENPDGMTVDQFGRLSWTPTLADVGIHRVGLIIQDTLGAGLTFGYDLTVITDTTAPQVMIEASRNPAHIGEVVTLKVTAIDNVAVTTIGLTLDGTPVDLDAAGSATLTFDSVAIMDAVATAEDTSGNTAQSALELRIIDPTDIDGPVIDITSLAFGEVITAPTDIIGTVSDDTLLFYKFEVAPVAGGEFVEVFHSSTPVTDGVLGTLDPTLLENDSYILRLTAEDAGGNIASTETLFNVSGSMKVGNFTLSFVDLSIPVQGIPITVGRTYDTLAASRSGDFGYGWRLDLFDVDMRTNVRLSGLEDLDIFNPYRVGTRIYLRLPDGTREAFTVVPKPVNTSFGGLFLFNISNIVSVEFRPDPGVTSRLSLSREIPLILTDTGELINAGNSIPFNPASPFFQPLKFTLTTREGIVFQIDPVSGDLDHITDRNGNRLTVQANGIISTTGKKVEFKRDPQGRITAVIDPMGNSITYEYDANGDLVAVTDRESNTTRFVYSIERPHFLDEIIDPFGRTGARSEYNDEGRLVRLLNVNDNAVELIHQLDSFEERIIDSLGNETVLYYDIRGNVITQIDAEGGVTNRTYDPNDNLLTETVVLDDETELTTTFTYDDRGNITSQTDPLGYTTLYTYDGFGNLLTATDPLGNTTTNIFDGKGNLLSTTDAAGNTTAFTYDTAGNLTSVKDVLDNVTSIFVHDSFGYLDGITYGADFSQAFTYDDNGNQTTRSYTWVNPDNPMDSREVTTETIYDNNGRVTGTIDEYYNETFIVYNELGNVHESTDALKNTMVNVYDARNQLVETQFPDGTVTRMVYDELGRLVYATDRYHPTLSVGLPNGTHNLYDKVGRVVGTERLSDLVIDVATKPDGSKVSFFVSAGEMLSTTSTKYDAANRVTEFTDAGETTKFEYDAAGRRTAIIDAMNERTEFEYDEAGRQILIRDALGHETQFKYDALGRVVKTIFPDQTFTETKYDRLGHRIKETDQNGEIRNFEYDEMGRLKAVVLPAVSDPEDGGLLKRPRYEYEYDIYGNLRVIRDPKGRETSFTYDELNRQTSRTLPLGQTEHTEYDQFGRVSRQIDFKGQVTEFVYDSLGRIVEKRLFENVAQVDVGLPIVTIVTAHDELGRLDTIDGPRRGLTDFTYNSDGRITQIDSAEGIINYEYDPATGRPIRVFTDFTDVHYNYDELGRLKTVETHKLNDVALVTPDVSTYSYTAVGSLESLDLPNGTQTTYQYDQLNRLTGIVTRSPPDIPGEPGDLLASYEYTLYPDGRRWTAIEIQRETDESLSERHLMWTYDALNRLIKEVSADVSGGRPEVHYTTTYVYDLVGNRLSMSTTNADGTHSVEYTYNDNNQLTREVTSDGTVTIYVYDDNGSLIEKHIDGKLVAKYIYNLENRLETATTFTTNDTGQEVVTTTTYLYDQNGIRVRATTEVRVGGVLVETNEQVFLIDPLNPTGFAQVLEERDANSISQVTYIIGDDVIAQVSTAGEVRYFLCDGHGSTHLLVDEASQITDRYDYDAHGNALNFDPSVSVTTLLYTGERFDSKIQQYYLRARCYDPTVGRFNRLDPFIGMRSDPGSLHKYLYANADPINARDPSGSITLFEISITSSIVGLLSGIVGGVAAKLSGGSFVEGFLTGFAAGFFSTALLLLGMPPPVALGLGATGAQFLTELFTGRLIESPEAAWSRIGVAGVVGLGFGLALWASLAIASEATLAAIITDLGVSAIFKQGLGTLTRISISASCSTGITTTINTWIWGAEAASRGGTKVIKERVRKIEDLLKDR